MEIVCDIVYGHVLLDVGHNLLSSIAPIGSSKKIWYETRKERLEAKFNKGKRYKPQVKR